jgi:ribosomal protein S18 acetylase RimI-like enzyme
MPDRSTDRQRRAATPAPTVTLRAYRDPDDLAGMAELINARDRRDGIGGPLVTAEAMADVYHHLQRCDLDTDMVVAEEIDDPVAGYARIQWDDVADGIRSFHIVFEADPDRPDIEAELLRWAERRAVAMAGENPAADMRLRAEAAAGSERAERLEALGLRPVRYSATMIRPDLDDIPELSLPDGVTTRPVEEADLKPIWEADIDAFRDHFGYVEQTETDWDKFRASAERGTELWHVAWAGDEVVGQVRTFVVPGEAERVGRRRGWTEDISTRRAWRRRGVASALICNSLRQLAAMGFDEAALSADTENLTGAFGLYESLGYRQISLGALYERRIG